jgi:hypothetical protein
VDLAVSVEPSRCGRWAISLDLHAHAGVELRFVARLALLE